MASDNELSNSTDKAGGSFRNPWSTWKFPSFRSVLAWRFTETDHSNVPASSKALDETLPIDTPDFTPPNADQWKITWIGHATVLVQFDNLNILTDPIFSNRCSPFSFTGPLRYRPPPCNVEELPKPDIVVISHNHYDHLDTSTVKDIVKIHGTSVKFFVPLGLKSWFLSCGIENVDELNWGDEVAFEKEGSTSRVVCLPCQHWSQRSAMDRNKTLWSSWGVMGPKHSFFFGGDSGYCPEFEKIGRLYGPFDVAALPIGCYEPRWFMKGQHMGPDEAVQVHNDIGSRFSLGVHWGTFNMGSTEFYLEPKTKLIEQVLKAGLKTTQFITLNHGHSLTGPLK